MRILGIDPGINGGVAVIDAASRDLIDVADIPTIPDGERREIDAWSLMCWVLGHDVTDAVIENVQPMPSQAGWDDDGNPYQRRGMGAVSAFRFGAGVFGIRAAVRCAKVPIVPVAPQSWKKHYALKGGDKEASRQLALHLWPAAADFFKRMKDHQRAEAALIARYYADKLAGVRPAAPAPPPKKESSLYDDAEPF